MRLAVSLMTLVPMVSQCDAVVTMSVPEVAAPVDGDCESWRPLFDSVGLPFDDLAPIMWRESRCTNVHSWSRKWRDDSYGALQVNRWGRIGRKWDQAGFTAEVMATPEGALRAAKLLYDRCGLGPWTKPYRCPKGWPL